MRLQLKILYITSILVVSSTFYLHSFKRYPRKKMKIAIFGSWGGLLPYFSWVSCVTAPSASWKNLSVQPSAMSVLCDWGRAWRRIIILLLSSPTSPNFFFWKSRKTCSPWFSLTRGIWIGWWTSASTRCSHRRSNNSSKREAPRRRRTRPMIPAREWLRRVDMGRSIRRIQVTRGNWGDLLKKRMRRGGARSSASVWWNSGWQLHSPSEKKNPRSTSEWN